MKIKCRPEDFRVTEISALPLRPQGEYAVYRLRKRGWNTVDALRRIARTFGLPWSSVAYGGKKDRYGETTQLVTLRDPGPRAVQAEHYSLEFLGYSPEPMGPHAIQGNRFEITVRKLTPADLERARTELDSVLACGYLNYFDDQRFGGYDPEQGFLGEKILRRHWNGALKAYLLSIHPQDARAEKERKRRLAAAWPEWRACARIAATTFEKSAFAYLTQHPGRFLPVLERVAAEDMHMAVSAYQSFLWNEWVRRWLPIQGFALPLSYPGAAGPYRFYARLTRPELAAVEPLQLPTLSGRMEFPDRRAIGAWEGVLAEHGLNPGLLLRDKLRAARFKSWLRPVWVKPGELTQAAGRDELYPGFMALRLRFRLPRGSYATLLLKRLFAEPDDERGGA